MRSNDFSSLYGNGYSDELIDKIVEKIKQYRKPKSIVHILIHCNQDKELQQMIFNATKFLDDAIANEICTSHMIRICERLYCILNGIHEILLCKVCGKPLKNFEITHTASLHYDCCSRKCKANDPDNINKRVLSYMSRSPEEKLKTKLQTEATIERRFGNKCFMKSERFKQKKLQYIKEHGGECNVSQVKEVREKVDNTNIDRYGNRCNLANKEQQEMRKQTYIENFGFDHPMKNPVIIDYLRELKNNEKKRIILDNEFVIPLFDVTSQHILNCFDKQYWWQCLECGHVFASQIIGYHRNDGRITKCPFCNFGKQTYGYSLQEIELVSFLRNQFPNLNIINRNPKINRHIISPYEIDIWIPEKKIGIEYNGSFWHSIEFCQRYHKNNVMPFQLLNKTQLCEAKDIHLIHIYEDEWVYDNENIKTLITHLIDNPMQYVQTLHSNDNTLILPYDKYSSFMTILGYKLISITEPTLQKHNLNGGEIYHIYDCGQLVFQKIE